MDKLKIVEYLSKEIDNKSIYIDEEMKKHTTFKVGGKADILIKVKNELELKYILKFANENNIQITILGNGSNVLVLDKGIRGIVLKIELGNIEFLENNEVLVESGVKLGFLAQKLLKENLSGFEAAAGIPGTIGGGLRMNAGAYGWEFKDCVIKTKCIDLDAFYKYLDFRKKYSLD